jgi:hypothetical protein
MVIPLVTQILDFVIKKNRNRCFQPSPTFPFQPVFNNYLVALYWLFLPFPIRYIKFLLTISVNTSFDLDVLIPSSFSATLLVMLPYFSIYFKRTVPLKYCDCTHVAKIMLCDGVIDAYY